MRLERRDVKALRKFRIQDGASVALRIIGLAALVALTIREGESGFYLGLVVFFLLQGCKPRLPGRLARLAEAEALEDDPRHRLELERLRHWRD